MTFQPAHKVVGDVGKPGQLTFKPDITLNDYIKRKQEGEGCLTYLPAAQPKKLSFEEWWDINGDKFPMSYPKASANLLWNAAQENK